MADVDGPLVTRKRTLNIYERAYQVSPVVTVP